jgi:hypothetical protein
MDGVSLSFSTVPFDDRSLFYPRNNPFGGDPSEGVAGARSRSAGESVTDPLGAGAAAGAAAGLAVEAGSASADSHGGRRGVIRPRAHDDGVDEAIRERSARSSAAIQSLLGSLMHPAFPMLTFGFNSRQEEEDEEDEISPPEFPLPRAPRDDAEGGGTASSNR